MKPTAPQLQALDDIERHGDPYKRVQGKVARTEWWTKVLASLGRRGWAKYDIRSGWILTEAGRKALETGARDLPSEPSKFECAGHGACGRDCPGRPHWTKKFAP